MDPLTLIVTALVAGAAAGGQDAISSLVKDAYGGLKTLVLRKVATVEAGTTAVEQHAKNPQVWDGPVKDAIATSGADHDEEVLAAARKLLEQVDPGGAREGKYTLNITASGERSIAAHTIYGGASTGDK
ncbi:hypothetical protein ACFY36_03155 [Actinoplanes sp. NPDC000266]